MNFDITSILEHWDYHPGQVIVRRFKGKDGVHKIQLRLDLGLLQMNAAGRPDGKRPFGHESLLEHYQSQLEKYRESHEGSEEGFQLSAEDCAKLQQETIQYHHRYICLFQLEDFSAVLMDTARNLEVFDFVRKYGTNDELIWSIHQFRPQLVMMKVRARASLELVLENFDAALEIIAEGIEEIKTFFHDFNRSDLIDQSGEIHSLEAWQHEVRQKRPLTEKEKLLTALDEAVRKEDYEKAAKVRDALKNLKSTL